MPSGNDNKDDPREGRVLCPQAMKDRVLSNKVATNGSYTFKRYFW